MALSIFSFRNRQEKHELDSEKKGTTANVHETKGKTW